MQVVCLTTDQLFCFPEKLSLMFSKWISWQNIKFMSWSFPRLTAAWRGVFMNSLQIANSHQIARWFSIDFSVHGEHGFHTVRCVRRHVEIEVPRRFRILLTFLVNWRTGLFLLLILNPLRHGGALLLHHVSAAGLSESSESSSSWCEVSPLLFHQHAKVCDAASNESSSHRVSPKLSTSTIFRCNRTRCGGGTCRNKIRRHSSSLLVSTWTQLFLPPFDFESSSPLRSSLSSRNSWYNKWSWNGWYRINDEDCSTHHVWNSLQSTCLRIGIWCQCLGFGFLGPD